MIGLNIGLSYEALQQQGEAVSKQGIGERNLISVNRKAWRVG